MIKLLTTLLLLFSTNAQIQASVEGKVFLFKYDGDQHYRVSFTKETLTWTGVKGMDAGRSETDAYEMAQLSPEASFIQWKELDGTFVALGINLKTKKIISTGVYEGKTWFRKGAFE